MQLHNNLKALFTFTSVGISFTRRSLVAGFILVSLVQTAAAIISWNIPGDGAWETGANWTGGVAPSNNDVYIYNAGSKIVTIYPSTSSGNLTILSLNVEAAGGATNTLLVSNTPPLTCNNGITLGNDANQIGSLVIDGGKLVTTNATWDAVGFNGIGIVTVLNGFWHSKTLYTGFTASGQGTINLVGGTNTFASTFVIGNSGAGTCRKTGGMLVTTNATATIGSSGSSGIGNMTVSGGQWQGNNLNVGNFGSSRGTLYLTDGTNSFNGTFTVASSAASTGSVWLTGGQLVTTNAASNASAFIGNAGIGDMTVSNGIWLANIIYLNYAAATGKGTLVVVGGQVNALELWAGGVANASNNTVLVTGGVLEANSLRYATPVGNVISNSGGVFQFSTPTPIISGASSSSSIAINGGTLSFRGVTNVNVKANWSPGSSVGNILFSGANTFRLNAATNAPTPNQSYVFDTARGATNYTHLELINSSLWRGGNVMIGSGGAALFSNGTAVVQGSLTNNGGIMTVVDCSLTVTGACDIGTATTINMSSNSAAPSLTVGGTLTLPASATFNYTGTLARDAQVTLMSGNPIIGTPSGWTTTLTTHRLRVVSNALVLTPRSSGFIIEVK